MSCAMEIDSGLSSSSFKVGVNISQTHQEKKGEDTNQ